MSNNPNVLYLRAILEIMRIVVLLFILASSLILLVGDRISFPATSSYDDRVGMEATSTEREVEIIEVLQAKEEPETPIPPKEALEEEALAVEQEVFSTSSPQSISALPSLVSFEEINAQTRAALVNILCIPNRNRLLQPITGSGVIIDEKGVILTNAHIAQYFLLEDLATCAIRTGSPAENAYIAELLFISPQWIQDNADIITQNNPTGTGENDYGLLRITGVISGEQPPQLPTTLPAVDNAEIIPGASVLLAGYPAGFLEGPSIEEHLPIVTAVTEIETLFTFTQQVLDIFSIGGNAVAQGGSSGGAVVDNYNRIIGIIVTSSSGESTGKRELRAITLSHINRALKRDAGLDLRTLLSSNLEARAQLFQLTVAPTLADTLRESLAQ